MKNKLNSVIIFFTLITVLIVSCNKQLEDDYYNPDNSQNASIETLFGKFSTLSRYHMQYWDLYTLQKSTVAVYTQILGYQNSPNRYTPSDSYVLDHWNRFYTEILPLYRDIQKRFNSLDEDLQKDYKYMMVAADAILFNELSKKTDMWGDIPFSEAGHLRSENQIIFPKFDAQQEIYTAMLNQLRENAALFVNAPQPTNLAQSMLNNYDFIYKGRIAGWQKFTNSLRLRFLARIMNSNEMGTSAKQEIQMILNNPTENPLIEENTDNALIASTGPSLSAIDNQHEGGPRGGFAGVVAGKAMLDVLKKGDFTDPRLQTLFSKNLNGDYAGLNPIGVNYVEIIDSVNLKLYSVIDSTTFRFNNFLPGVLFTASEIHFLKSEILQGAEAEKAFTDGIKHSIDWYYYIRNLNSKNNGKEVGPLLPPSDDEKSKVATYYLKNYYQHSDIGKSAAIGIQRWIHFGPLQMYEAWSDMRRYKYPKLAYLKDAGTVQEPISRFQYPSKEYADNFNMSQQIKDKDNFYTKVWWDN